MWPLALASILALGTAIERLVVLRGALAGAEDVIEEAARRVSEGRVDEARAAALRAGGPVGRVLVYGLDAWARGRQACESAMIERAMVEREGLTKRLVVLDTVVTVAPLLGLLGTVTGMIKAFKILGERNQIGSPTAITGGVAEALIATATGLGIAIVSLVLYNYLNERVRQVVGLMEIGGTRLANIRAERSPVEEDSAPRAVSA